ncbi:antibiotic biosynthesis monooxygenase [Chitinibacter tainanensis]|jgi:heme-degrading monooxygenase HmoA|uniref:antibiotic biosynthesis monooxygenase family protein n=1 Tax=Chitinibacter tainanensis TaxID=230667 RepID=UPI00235420C0|nr:antibiotic biosynthesis monooxygenase [Chitinibacter tainanensis]
MIAIIFEVELANNAQADYLQFAAELRPLLEQMDGFISIERFESLSQPGKILSLSFWRDEQAVMNWRNLEQHRLAQKQGISHIFSDYRLRVASVMRDYGLNSRGQAPADSQAYHH